MARSRTPIGIQVNGVALLVKDPDAESTDLFAKYQRVPGIASFTLPDETGSTNEVQLQDGNIAFAQIAGIGTITGSIGAISAHPTHRFLASKRRDGGNVTVAIARPAIRLSSAGATANFSIAADGTVVSAAAGTSAERFLKAMAKEGVLFALGSTGTTFDAEGVFGDHTAVAADDDKFRAIVAVNDAGDKFSVEVAHDTGVTAAGQNVFEFRQAGVQYIDVTVTVNGFGDGDFQAGGAVTSNISLQPSVALPVMTPEVRLRSEYGASAFDGVFAALT